MRSFLIVLAVVLVLESTVVLALAPLGVPTEITGFSTVHGLASEHKFCFLSEAINPFETKSVMPEESSAALPANTAVI